LTIPLLVLGGGGAILSAGAAAHTRDRSESVCGPDFDVGRFGARSTPTWKPYVGPKTGRAPPRNGARSRRSRQRGLDASFSRALGRTGGVLAIHSRSCRPRGRGANVRHCLVGCRSDLRRDRGRPVEGLASDRAVRESYPGDRARIVLRLSRPSTDCSVADFVAPRAGVALAVPIALGVTALASCALDLAVSRPAARLGRIISNNLLLGAPSGQAAWNWTERPLKCPEPFSSPRLPG